MMTIYYVAFGFMGLAALMGRSPNPIIAVARWGLMGGALVFLVLPWFWRARDVVTTTTTTVETMVAGEMVSYVCFGPQSENNDPH